jgi:hypothetical protein
VVTPSPDSRPLPAELSGDQSYNYETGAGELMNILVEDKNGQWWKFFGVKDHLFEVLWAGDKYSTGFDTSAVADAPLIYGQSGRKTPGELCKVEIA